MHFRVFCSTCNLLIGSSGQPGRPVRVCQLGGGEPEAGGDQGAATGSRRSVPPNRREPGSGVDSRRAGAAAVQDFASKSAAETETEEGAAKPRGASRQQEESVARRGRPVWRQLSWRQGQVHGGQSGGWLRRGCAPARSLPPRRGAPGAGEALSRSQPPAFSRRCRWRQVISRRVLPTLSRAAQIFVAACFMFLFKLTGFIDRRRLITFRSFCMYD